MRRFLHVGLQTSRLTAWLGLWLAVTVLAPALAWYPEYHGCAHPCSHQEDTDEAQADEVLPEGTHQCGFTATVQACQSLQRVELPRAETPRWIVLFAVPSAHAPASRAGTWWPYTLGPPHVA